MTGAAAQPDARMSAVVGHIETCLDALDTALTSGEVAHIETQAQALQRALADAMATVQHQGAVAPAALTPDLRQRLQRAQTRAQGQQQAVNRALASTGRALGALFPQEGNDTYGELGQSPAARALGKAYR